MLAEVYPQFAKTVFGTTPVYGATPGLPDARPVG
jgi:hypothetical protein